MVGFSTAAISLSNRLRGTLWLRVLRPLSGAAHLLELPVHYRYCRVSEGSYSELPICSIKLFNGRYGSN